MGTISPNQPVIRFWMSLWQKHNLGNAAFLSLREIPREEINAEFSAANGFHYSNAFSLEVEKKSLL